mgnify:CR=1 FL=1
MFRKVIGVALVIGSVAGAQSGSVTDKREVAPCVELVAV